MLIQDKSNPVQAIPHKQHTRTLFKPASNSYCSCQDDNIKNKFCNQVETSLVMLSVKPSIYEYITVSVATNVLLPYYCMGRLAEAGPLSRIVFWTTRLIFC